ncbi:MAG TPA: hypothetical protein VG322_13465 [Candidatus Acidoferrales bacterium]|nr:hypothetical protein [Candidatus Acidoferrales bacterium]
MSTNNLRYPNWQSLCVDALAELNVEKLPHLIAAAEIAIAERLKELGTSTDDVDERLAVSDAMKTLRGLKREKLKLPV